MICPVCRNEGKRVDLTLVSSSTTLMSAHSFHGRDGRFHYHDPNVQTEVYICPHGHDIVASRILGCKECGTDDKVTFVEI